MVILAYDFTKNEGIEIGSNNTIKTKLTMPIEGQSLCYANITIQKQSDGYGSIGTSSTTYNSETREMETTITLTDDELETLVTAMSENKDAYKISVQVVIKVSDGTTEYPVPVNSYSFKPAIH